MPELQWKSVGIETRTYEGVEAIIADLTPYDNIHAIVVELRVRNTTTAAVNRTVFDAFGPIRLLREGSTAIVAGMPKDLIRVHHYRTGTFPRIVINQAANAVQSAVVPIYFGMSLSDPNFYLPTSRLKDVKLIISMPDRSGGGAFDPAQTTADVWVLRTKGGVPGSYVGTFLVREVVNKVLTGSGILDMPLTVGPRYARIFVTYEHPTTNMSDGIGMLRLSANAIDDFFVDASLDRVLKGTFPMFPFRATLSGILAVAHGATVDLPFGNISQVLMTNAVPHDATADTLYESKVTAIAGRRLTVGVWTARWTGTNFDVATDATAQPHYFISVHDGLPDYAVFDFISAPWSEPLRSMEFNTLVVKVEDRQAGAVVKVIPEEVVSF